MVTVAQPAAATTGPQFTLFDEALTNTATTYGNPVFVTPNSWVTPTDYSQGRVYLRLQVTSKPSSKPVRFQLCGWQATRSKELCSGGPIVTDEGLYWADLGRPASWWQKNWNFGAGPEISRMMLKDPSTGRLLMSSLCGAFCYIGDDLALHVPISYHASVVVVAQGQTLSPLSSWAGCPATWSTACQTGSVRPSMTSQPQGASVRAGSSATFSVGATGTAPLSYQWMRNGSPIPGATSSSYSTPSLSVTDSGSQFSAVVTNDVGSATSAVATLTVTEAPAPPLPGVWWDDAFGYRVALTSVPAGAATVDAPLVVPFNGAALLSAAGGSGTFDPSSLRVVEVGTNGSVTDGDVPFQFEPATPGALSGELVVIAEGATAAGSSRRFDVYFDDTASGHAPASPTTLVDTVDGPADQGFANWRTQTPNGEWVFHSTGGGFAHFYDNTGADWLSWKTTAGAAGDFRGVPNAVHPTNGGYFHPGRSNATSTILANGPARTVIRSVSANNAFETRWEIYPRYAEMTMVRKATNYWFLYEGTPGGSVGTEDKVIRSNGTVTPLATAWSADLTTPEWALFADATANRSFLAAKRTDDAAVDSHRVMDGVMTVFGFGRDGNSPRLSASGQEFVVGLVDGASAAGTQAGVTSATTVVVGSLGAPQAADGTGGGTSPSGLESDTFAGSSLGSHWSVVNPTGHGSVTVGAGRAALSVPTGASHDLWTGNRDGLRILQPSVDVDFAIEAVFAGAPTSGVSVEGIVVESATGDLLRFDLHRGGAGLRSYVGAVTATSATQLHAAPNLGSGVARIRVTRSGSTWTMQVARGTGALVTVATVNRPMAVANVGVWVGNAGANPTVTAQLEEFTVLG